ncbi:MAG: BamA/TamA family outer membrane protein [Candidatus Paraprevotella stercoravium]|uniref:BamA/TamA family outer membrane protein n=1 Tax=Candidatus Paraprevotella stercoravium TaxID=2838725 RepID=A0A9E2L8U3_9BACT|nr:BamA/TamA family outer membrane protein [Candidatus Paraprevotella stercoravium]
MKYIIKIISSLSLLLVLYSCSATKFIPEGYYMLDRVNVQSEDKRVKANSLKGYIRQHPNSRWFSLVKVPMGPYALSGKDSTKAINRFLQRIGEMPVVYDSLEAERTRVSIEAAVRNMGYLQARAETETQIKGKKIKVNFRVIPGELYKIRNFTYEIADSVQRKLYECDSLSRLLHARMPFDMNRLEEERVRITNLFQNNGYYLFNKDYIRYEADSTIQNRMVDVKMIVALPLQNDSVSHLHRQYQIGKVEVFCDVDEDETASLKQIEKNGYQIFFRDHLKVRPTVLADRIVLEQGRLYRESDVQATYNNLGRLYSVLSTNVHLVPRDSSVLDSKVTVTTNRPHSIGAELEGTNSAGDLGAALSFSYQNRNLFHGSELFTLKVRGAFEAITGLEGYADQNYIEFSTEAGLMLPNLKLPLWKRHPASVESTSEVSVMYDSQNRPEFHRRVLTGALRYRWTNKKTRLQHRLDLVDLNYIFMPWISETFKKDYLDDEENRNAILRYNYENLFIVKQGYSMVYNSQGDAGPNASYGKNATAIRLNIETAGNLLYGMSNLLHTQKNGNNQYTLFNIAYAQYVKGDFDFSRSFKFDERNSLAIHAALGISYPYGNSTILPYEKRYFSGGANSVRGWSVRGLGPGTYAGTDGRIDFINQTGDIKLDLSMEYRTFLFWKLHGAVFLDAGNIWTIRSYEDQPGGQFRIGSFYKQIAAAYGLGLRLNFDFFILRLDGGMKAVNPAGQSKETRYPLIHPNFKRDFTLHFAVGLPF